MAGRAIPQQSCRSAKICRSKWEDRHEVTRDRARAATALAAAVPAPALAQGQPRVIVVTHGQSNDPFWTVVKNGVAAAGKDGNVQVDYRAPETFDMVAMSQLVDAAANQKPAGLVVSIPDASALGPAIKKAVAAGIPVISMNSGSDVSKGLGALLHVGQDELVAGRAAGAKLKELGGKVGLCVNHEVGNVGLDLRCKGFEETFGGKVTVLPVPIDPTEIRSKVKAALSLERRHRHGPDPRRGEAGEPAVAADQGAQQDRRPGRLLRPLRRLPQACRGRRGGVRDRPAAVSAGLPAGRSSSRTTHATA